jgi:hypothetical protein
MSGTPTAPGAGHYVTEEAASGMLPPMETTRGRDNMPLFMRKRLIAQYACRHCRFCRDVVAAPRRSGNTGGASISSFNVKSFADQS